MKAFLNSLRQDTRGTSAIEYGIICAMVVIAIVSAVRGLGSQNGGVWANIATKATNAMDAVGS
jgi:pilus assembly protein Flp/PilA